MTNADPIRLEVEVPLPPKEAFEHFTLGIGSWWPLHRFSISGADAADAAVDGFVGGAIYEIARNGERHPWGRILVWDPPARLVFTWHPGRPEAEAQEVEVRFAPSAEGTTVELEHRGWETLGARAEEVRKSYPSGWAFVLGEQFAASARARAGAA